MKSIILLLLILVSCQPGKSGKLDFSARNNSSRTASDEANTGDQVNIPTPVTFDEVQTVFKRYNCDMCHGDWVNSESKMLSDGRVKKGNPNGSRLYLRIIPGRPNRMPPMGAPLSDDEIELVANYILGLKS